MQGCTCLVAVHLGHVNSLPLVGRIFGLAIKGIGDSHVVVRLMVDRGDGVTGLSRAVLTNVVLAAAYGVVIATHVLLVLLVCDGVRTILLRDLFLQLIFQVYRSTTVQLVSIRLMNGVGAIIIIVVAVQSIFYFGLVYNAQRLLIMLFDLGDASRLRCPEQLFDFLLVEGVLNVVVVFAACLVAFDIRALSHLVATAGVN